MTISYEEFKVQFYNYKNREVNFHWWDDPFYNTIKYRREILYSIRNSNSLYCREHLFGKSSEEICKFLYDINYLFAPLDLAFSLISLNDTVITKNGLMGRVINISLKSYLTIELFGSNRQVKRRPETVIKITSED